MRNPPGWDLGFLHLSPLRSEGLQYFKPDYRQAERASVLPGS
jgi:hypothetical protein